MKMSFKICGSRISDNSLKAEKNITAKPNFAMAVA